MKKILIPLLGLCISCSACKETPVVTSSGQRSEAPVSVPPPAQPVTSEEPATSAPEGQTVWVCQSSGATRYHLDRNCHGLRRCDETIEKTTVTAAERVGLTLCKYED